MPGKGMYFLRFLRAAASLVIFVWLLLTLLAAIAFAALIWLDDNRRPDDFSLTVASWTFQDGKLQYFTRKGGGDTAICSVPSDSRLTYPVGSKVLVSVSMFFNTCSLAPLNE